LPLVLSKVILIRYHEVFEYLSGFRIPFPVNFLSGPDGRNISRIKIRMIFVFPHSKLSCMKQNEITNQVWYTKTIHHYEARLMASRTADYKKIFLVGGRVSIHKGK